MLASLRASGVRILGQADLQPCSGLNLITGANGAGKTSLLEAIDILSRGRSFRARRLHELLARGQTCLRVTGQVRHHGEMRRLGIERRASGTRFHCQGASERSVAALAELLPLQVMHPGSHRLVAAGPDGRRAFIDWGVFHVEPRFLSAWRRYRRALSQRNASLRQTGDPAMARAWHHELSQAGEATNTFRRAYVEALKPEVQASLAVLLPGAELSLEYRSGWEPGVGLAAVLQDRLHEDLQRGYTVYGPHRAELELRWRGEPAATVVSRGQQKLIVAALLVGQLRLFKARTGRGAVFLADDLPSELDKAHRTRFLAALRELETQVFVSALEADILDSAAWPVGRRFHVEQGEVREVV